VIKRERKIFSLYYHKTIYLEFQVTSHPQSTEIDYEALHTCSAGGGRVYLLLVTQEKNRHIKGQEWYFSSKRKYAYIMNKQANEAEKGEDQVFIDLLNACLTSQRKRLKSLVRFNLFSNEFRSA
jgi:hypothetical protein